MNKKISYLLIAVIIIILAVVGIFIYQNGNKEQQNNIQNTNFSNEEISEQETYKDNKEKENLKILIAFFSRADENYSVGTVEIGNTEMMAKNIAELTGGDLFKIEPVNKYPSSYKEATDVAQQEKSQNSRPEIKNKIDNIDEYDTIFIGYPIWWGDMPMCVYTFLESYDFSNKTIIPFNTHEGSGNAGTYTTIKNKLTSSNVLDGLAIRGKEAREDSSKQIIENWIKELNF